jgi:D-beta-D-heptose 7-phosphate kinase/D-beta-D-heptose 1-phosphate adenosyltransferase
MFNKEQGIGKYKEIIFDSETPEGIQKISDIKTENPNSIIVFATGCMDVAQPGHPIFTEQLRLTGENIALEKGELSTDTKIIVVMGIGRDSTLKTLKKEGRPINPEMNRAYLVASYKDVDYVILNNRDIGEGKVDFGEVLRILKPDVFVINSDDSAIDIKARLCSNLGINFRKVERIVPDFLNPTSSTEIIAKIKGLS